jgi:hypothetical protein
MFFDHWEIALARRGVDFVLLPKEEKTFLTGQGLCAPCKAGRLFSRQASWLRIIFLPTLQYVSFAHCRWHGLSPRIISTCQSN